MKNIIPITMIPIFLTSCTLSMIQTDTHGTASDVVDDTSTSSPDIKPDVNLSLPVKPL